MPNWPILGLNTLTTAGLTFIAHCTLKYIFHLDLPPPYDLMALGIEGFLATAGILALLLGPSPNTSPTSLSKNNERRDIQETNELPFNQVEQSLPTQKKSEQSSEYSSSLSKTPQSSTTAASTNKKTPSSSSNSNQKVWKPVWAPKVKRPNQGSKIAQLQAEIVANQYHDNEKKKKIHKTVISLENNVTPETQSTASTTSTNPKPRKSKSNVAALRNKLGASIIMQAPGQRPLKRQKTVPEPSSSTSTTPSSFSPSGFVTRDTKKGPKRRKPTRKPRRERTVG